MFSHSEQPTTEVKIYSTRQQWMAVEDGKEGRKVKESKNVHFTILLNN